MFSLLVTWDTIPHYILRLLRYASASRIRLLARHLMPVFSSSAALCVSIAPSSISPAFNAGIFFVSYVGYYPALYSLYCVRYASASRLRLLARHLMPVFSSDVGFCCLSARSVCRLYMPVFLFLLVPFHFTSSLLPIIFLLIGYPCATLGLLLLVG